MPKPCNICGDSEGLDVYYRLSKKGETYTVLRCHRCGLVFTDVEFQTEIIRSPGFYGSGESYYFDLEEEFYQDFSEKLGLISKVTGLEGGKVLDYGCGPGYFLKVASEGEWQPYGIDIQASLKELVKANQGIDIEIGLIEDDIFSPGFFELVTMWNVIEHLPDPLLVLRRLHRVIKLGGMLVVETPNEDSLARKAGRALYLLSRGRVQVVNHFYELPPEHVFCFSEETLTRLLGLAGFKVVHVERINSNIEFIKRGAGRGRALKRWLTNVGIDLVFWAGRMLSLPTRMMVIAVKSNSSGD